MRGGRPCTSRARDARGPCSPEHGRGLRDRRRGQGGAPSDRDQRGHAGRRTSRTGSGQRASPFAGRQPCERASAHAQRQTGT